MLEIAAFGGRPVHYLRLSSGPGSGMRRELHLDAEFLPEVRCAIRHGKVLLTPLEEPALPDAPRQKTAASGERVDGLSFSCCLDALLFECEVSEFSWP